MIRGERGATLLGVLVVGSLVVALALQAATTTVRLADANQRAAAAAQQAAEWAARYGDVDDALDRAHTLEPTATVTAEHGPRGIAVLVTLPVTVIGPEGSIEVSVAATAVAQPSPYRSAP